MPQPFEHHMHRIFRWTHSWATWYPICERGSTAPQPAFWHSTVTIGHTFSCAAKPPARSTSHRGPHIPQPRAQSIRAYGHTFMCSAMSPGRRTVPHDE